MKLCLIGLPTYAVHGMLEVTVSFFRLILIVKCRQTGVTFDERRTRVA